jgi:iron complex outermembrane recepter protein
LSGRILFTFVWSAAKCAMRMRIAAKGEGRAEDDWPGQTRRQCAAHRAKIASALVSVASCHIVSLSHAQRADANAVIAAQDAFGTSLNGQSLGLYTVQNIRNFNPMKLGNMRMDGLYFDKQGNFTSQLIESSSVRVGINALDYPFSAPSGLVDFHVRDYERADECSFTAGIGPFVSPYLESDFKRRIVSDFLFATGGAAYSIRENVASGQHSVYSSAALNVIMRRSGASTVSIYANRIWDASIAAPPVFYLADARLPAIPTRGRNIGQEWAKGAGSSTELGIRGSSRLGKSWALDMGLVYSGKYVERGFDQVFAAVDSSGRSDPVIYAYTDQNAGALSGESRITFQTATQRTSHKVHASIRGRRLMRRFGGEQAIDVATADIYQAEAMPQPTIGTNAHRRDAITQALAGLQYKGELDNILLVSAGIQTGYYRKDSIHAVGLSSQDQSVDTLLRASAAIRPVEALALYADHSEGLEEGGVAPANAVNRYQVLSVIKGKQDEVGLRYSVRDLLISLSVFETNKPYAAMDATNAYRIVGVVRNRGLESSFSTVLFSSVKIVAGMLVMQPRLTIESSGTSHAEQPVGVPTRKGLLGIDYRFTPLPALSFDATVNHAGGVAFGALERQILHDQVTLALGARYSFAVSDVNYALRFQVTNVLDESSWMAATDGSMTYSPQRTFNVAVTARL